MNSNEFFDFFKEQIKKENGAKKITDTKLAEELGIYPSQLVHYRKNKITPKLMYSLMSKFAGVQKNKFTDEAIVPIVEFFKIQVIKSKQAKKEEIFSIKDINKEDHPYYQGVMSQLKENNGIYIFHDSVGKAIYAGKAKKQSLWSEMNLVFNRDRGDLQNILKVTHPKKKVTYKPYDEKRRQIKPVNVPLHQIAFYFSAYKVPDEMIDKFEALIIRAFPNDLLNKKMENF